jgi:hypothetical protein
MTEHHNLLADYPILGFITSLAIFGANHLTVITFPDLPIEIIHWLDGISKMLITITAGLTIISWFKKNSKKK